MAHGGDIGHDSPVVHASRYVPATALGVHSQGVPAASAAGTHEEALVPWTTGATTSRAVLKARHQVAAGGHDLGPHRRGHVGQARSGPVAHDSYLAGSCPAGARPGRALRAPA